jgi:4-hydroxy-tetrahydrodipicolinate synthase
MAQKPAVRPAEIREFRDPQTETRARLTLDPSLARAEKAGADAVVSVTPYYARPPQRGLIAFFVDLAARTELPFLIYHIPSRAAVSVAAETFEEIAERCRNFVGLKNTDDNLPLASRLISRLGPNFRIFGGLAACRT